MAKGKPKPEIGVLGMRNKFKVLELRVQCQAVLNCPDFKSLFSVALQIFCMPEDLPPDTKNTTWHFLTDFLYPTQFTCTPGFIKQETIRHLANI